MWVFACVGLGLVCVGLLVLLVFRFLFTWVCCFGVSDLVG